ncbi:MAG: glutamine--tRNA ligase/YqeY domain fusion protein [Planctomycetota bacterium]
MTEQPNQPSQPDPANQGDAPRKHFLRHLVDQEVASGRWGRPGDASVVRTRFPPEPNGFLHIGHAKSICLNFGLAEAVGGACNLRFDDTNPTKEEQRYVDSIVRDVRWLGYRWPDAHESDHTSTAGVLFASDYFEALHAWAVELINKGKAYVDEQDAETIRRQRGSLKSPGEASPFRERLVSENLARFNDMCAGRVADGGAVLRAKIDMASPNMNMRDPVMYRVVNAPHHRTGDAWHVYPMYDWAHGLEDSIEGITHSLCTLEFEDHRPLYDWFIDAINEGRGRHPGQVADFGPEIHHPQQTEFARLNPTTIVTSKRKLRELVDGGHVSGWDDPRMPTISGLRRRGYTPESVRAFCEGVGVTKFNAVHDILLLENALREDLNKRAPRTMAVVDPIRVTITNWGEHGEGDRVELFTAINNPEDASAGTREVPFAPSLWIERDDFMMDAPKKFFRLAPGREVRLRSAYWVKCHDVGTDSEGNPAEVFCTYDPQTRGGENPPPDSEGKVRKVKGTLHWVSAQHAVDAEVRLFDRLFSVDRPDKAPKDAPEGWSFLEHLNPDSLRVLANAKIEPALAASVRDTFLPAGLFNAEMGELGPIWQFERLGYFCLDSDSSPERPVFNRAVSLKDSWAKAGGGKKG